MEYRAITCTGKNETKTSRYKTREYIRVNQLSDRDKKILIIVFVLIVLIGCSTILRGFRSSKQDSTQAGTTETLVVATTESVTAENKDSDADTNDKNDNDSVDSSTNTSDRDDSDMNESDSDNSSTNISDKDESQDSEISEHGSSDWQEVEYVEYNFRNNDRLTEHYKKHGKEMGFKSAEEYEDAASDVVNNPNALHKTEKEDGDDVYYVEDTNEFVVVSSDGYIRTYFYPSAGIDYYNRQ